MGKFPPNIAKIIKVGSTDLIPPVVVNSQGDRNNLDPKIKDYLLQSRLDWNAPSKTLINLYALHMKLTDLIRNTHTYERHLHEFLLNNPIALDSYGLQILSEVRLGNQYRVDLIFQNSFVNQRLLLIELERSDIPIFTKQGRPRAKVTHAIQQVEDWMRWFKENPSQVSASLDTTIPISGMVIIGRSINLDEDDKRRLLHLNYNRKVQVITYDDLLEQIKALINNLEDTALE